MLRINKTFFSLLTTDWLIVKNLKTRPKNPESPFLAVSLFFKRNLNAGLNYKKRIQIY